MQKIINLKKCPFCGGEAQLVEAPINRLNLIPCFAVSCKKCKIMIGTVEHGQTDFYRTPYEAIAAWNRRTEE